MKFGLANIATLCAALGHPEAAFPSIIVAGTNGKGSVTAMVDTALRAAGHRSARYTSPHLVRIEERFVIDGREVTPQALEAAALLVQRAAEALVAAGQLEALPTFFECTTAVAFVLFRDAKVDLAVLEVGLGGRLDATNIVSPIAAAIVSIDVDHEAQLGTSVASIAAEKAGVIKPGIPVVCGPLPRRGARGGRARSARSAAPRLIRTDTDGRLSARVGAMPLSLPGDHQRANAAVALALLETIDADTTLDLHVAADAMRAGLTTASWPGRLERFEATAASVVLDAAHNPAGARALAAYLRRHRIDAASRWCSARCRTRRSHRCWSALAPAVTSLICVTAPNPRAAPAAELARLAAGLGLRAEPIEDPIAAVRHACTAGRTVVVAGSIFLIGPVREWLAHDILR